MTKYVVCFHFFDPSSRRAHDRPAQALALFNDYLCDAVAVLHPFVLNNVAPDFFYSRFPAYRRSRPGPASTASQVVWELAEVRAALPFAIPLDELDLRLTPPTH